MKKVLMSGVAATAMFAFAGVANAQVKVGVAGPLKIGRAHV